MDPAQQKMKDARAEIEAVFEKYDIGGFVTITAGEGWGEVFWNIWPSYSILSGDFPAIRIKSKLHEDHGGDVAKQKLAHERTAQTVHHIGTTMAECALQFLQFGTYLDHALNAEHTAAAQFPDPSKLER